MAAGKLYTFPENFRAYRAQIAAEYAGVKVNVVSTPPEFKFGETNKSASFLAKFPLGKVPAFEAADGTCVFEANAIARYLADKLHGADKVQQAHVEQWISFADNEIVPAMCTMVFPCLGLMQFNKQNSTKAKEDLKTVLTILNNHLKTRTFLVGERVSQADITVCTSLLLAFQYVLEPDFRKPFVNVLRWFNTLVNQPQFQAVVPNFKMCDTAATFDATKYNQLHGKGEGGKKEGGKGKQEGAKGKQEGGKGKQEKAKPKEEEREPEKEIAEPSEPPFCIDTWKKKYRNCAVTESVPYLWEHFDPNEYSIYKCDYQYLEDIPKEGFMCSNLINGMFQRLDAIRKQSFGLIAYFGDKKKNIPFRIHGVFLWKHPGNIFDGRTDLVGDHLSYKWTKLDHTNEADRKYFEEFLACEGDFDGKILQDIKMFV